MENNTLNEDVLRFKQIAEYQTPRQSLKNIYEHVLNEYTFITSPQINEEGEEDVNQETMAQNNTQPMGNAPSDGSQQMGDMNQPMGDANMGQVDNQQPINNQQPVDGTQQMDVQSEMGEMPTDNVPFDVVSDEGDIDTMEMEGDDEFIDIDELTQSQQAMEYKIDGVDDRLAKLFAVVQKFSDGLERNREEILSLKDEFEKRNPSQEEKFNLRSQSSYPYSTTPKAYWEEKTQKDPHYNVIYDNDIPTDEEDKNFEIKKSDISGLNMKNISDTLNIKQNLNDYLKF